MACFEQKSKGMVKAESIQYIPTSITDGTAFSAMSKAVEVFMQKKDDMVKSMTRFAEKYDTKRICLYSKEGIPITSYGTDSNLHQVNEKMSFQSMFRILSLIEASETLVSNFVIGRNHYIFQIVVDQNTLLSATTTKTPALDRVLADVYAMRDEIRTLVSEE